MNERIGPGKARMAEAVLSLGISLRFEESGEEPGVERGPARLAERPPGEGYPAKETE